MARLLAVLFLFALGPSKRRELKDPMALKRHRGNYPFHGGPFA